MKNIKLLNGIFVIALLASCGGKKGDSAGSESMQPETTVVSGDLGDCFEVVDRQYKITDTDGLYNLITVELQRTDSSLPFDLDSDAEVCSYSTSLAKPHIQVGFGIEFLDEDGNVLDKVSASGSGLSGSYDSDEAVDLVKLKDGEKGSIRFSVGSSAKNATQFRITSSYTEKEGFGSSSENDEVVSVVSLEDLDDDDGDDDYGSSSSSNDYDAMLDSYEKYVDKYVSIMKKAAAGDMTALAEYPALLEKAEEFSSKMSKAEGNMTAAQWARYTKITHKMVEGATTK